MSSFDTKIAVLLRDDLASWQRLNVTAFLVSGIAHVTPELMGEPYEDADGTAYLPMFGQPVLVFSGNGDVLTAAHGRALGRGLRISIFTDELFHTGNDDDNRAAVRAVPGRSSRWRASRCTARRTPSTRSSRARPCTGERNTGNGCKARRKVANRANPARAGRPVPSSPLRRGRRP